MNQILSTESSQKKEIKKNKNKKSNSGGSGSIAVKKAAIIFSIILILFALVILSVKLVQIAKNKAQNGKIGMLNKPQITIERVNADKVNINVSYDEDITKISWWWNEDISQIQERNYNVKSVAVDIPDGETNILNVEVIGADGKSNKIEETLTREYTIEIERNQIPETDNMELVATSDKGIEKMVYYWNEESPVTIPATQNNQKELKTTIQLKRGMNTLHVIVTDVEGNTREKEEMLQCVKQPEIDVQINLDQMLMVVTVTHDMGLKKIEFEANGKKVVYDENYAQYNPDRTKVTLKARLKEGIDNTASVEAYSNEEIEDGNTTHATYRGHKDLTDMNTDTEEE